MTIVRARPSDDRHPVGYGDAHLVRRSMVPRGAERARMDLRGRYPLRFVFPTMMFLGAVITAVLVSFANPPRYTATVELAVLKLDDGAKIPAIQIVDGRIQSILSLARSEAFLQEVKIRSGTTETLDDLSGVIDATRPAIAAFVFLTASSTNEELVRELAPHLAPSIASLVDKARSGALVVLDDSGRNAFADQTSDYRGPLYLELFGGRPDISVQTSGGVMPMFVGAGIGAFVALGGVLFTQSQARVSSKSLDELNAVIDVGQTGRLPRVRGRPSRSRSLMVGLAVQIDGQCPRGLDRLALGGTGIARERTMGALQIATALSVTMQRRVVVIDADVSRSGLTSRLRLKRFPGIRELMRGDLAIRDAVVELTGKGATRRLPWRIRSMFRRDAPDVAVIPAGTPAPEGVEEVEEAPIDAIVADVIEQMSREALVVVALPTLPAPHSVQRIMASVDACIVLMLDGWSLLDDAEEDMAVMSSLAPGRIGYVLIDN